MKIAILGTRGIPNNYGGFEQFAEYISVGLVKKGHSVTVYNSHGHLFQEKEYQGVDIVHQYDPEYKIGTVGQFIYDFNCIMDSRDRGFDIILQLGYTSSAIWGNFLPKMPIVVTNMDGLEWKRSKFSKWVQKFLKWSERKAIKTSDYWIADSVGIQDYLLSEYSVKSQFIPYGAFPFMNPDISIIESFDLKPYSYDIMIARIEPENNIGMILEGFVEAKSNRQLLVIGDYKRNEYGSALYKTYAQNNSVQFLGSIYDLNILNNLRYYSNLYYHGHSVGGTNPSLLEAMASQSLVIAHDNVFNQTVLTEKGGRFFKNKDELSVFAKDIMKKDFSHLLEFNLRQISIRYNWDRIIEEYDVYFKQIIKQD